MPFPIVGANQILNFHTALNRKSIESILPARIFHRMLRSITTRAIRPASLIVRRGYAEAAATDKIKLSLALPRAVSGLKQLNCSSALTPGF